MPTRGTLPFQTESFAGSELNWTDDLPSCRLTGIGTSTNQIYRDGGHRQEDHVFEDKHFFIRHNDNIYLYGVFDGHEGYSAALFASQRVAAELLLGQLNGKTTDDEIRELLRLAIINVEKSYLESVDGKVAERTSLLDEIPKDWNSYEVYQQDPCLIDRLKQLNQELSSGTTAVIALIVGDKLFVANVGDSRALLCKTDENGVLRVVQLSVDHDLSNEDEILRLNELGVKIDLSSTRLGNQDVTRCIGNYLLKGAYQEFDELSSATEEPVIAEPEICAAIKIDDSCRFLLLMSDGLYRSLEQATGTDQVNKEIAQMVFTEFQLQSTLTGVAQQVVDKVVRLHHDRSLSREKPFPQSRDDITLLVRNFNQSLPHSQMPISVSTPAPEPEISQTSRSSASQNTEDSSSTTASNSRSDTVNEVQAYVDFTEFLSNYEQAKQNGTLPTEFDDWL